MLDDARALKAGLRGNELEGKTIGLLFFNPSLRTRTSFEIGARQLGGAAVILEPGKGAWPIAFEPGVVMDGDEEEHISEVARVLSRYCDLIGVRAFPKFQDWSKDREDRVVRSVAAYATVPVINLETITHPCQELALMLALQEKFGGQVDGKKFVLTWTYHPKPLNTAVANSALMIAARSGRASMVKWLVDCGATINQADQAGMTPLHYAVVGTSLDAVKILTHRGASERARDAEGKTALDIARQATRRDEEGACPDIVAFLESAPGDRDDAV